MRNQGNANESMWFFAIRMAKLKTVNLIAGKNRSKWEIKKEKYEKTHSCYNAYNFGEQFGSIQQYIKYT